MNIIFIFLVGILKIKVGHGFCEVRKKKFTFNFFFKRNLWI